MKSFRLEEASLVDVLISGGGIGGSTLAYWLARGGLRPTVVERSTGLRSSGSPVDVTGPAVAVAERMGVMERLREVGTATEGMTFVNAGGRRAGRISMRAVQGGGGQEVARGDLATILYEAARDDAEYLWDDSITALDQDEHGVDVTFDRAAPRRFDLVVGADGLHSNVRRLAFGPEADYVRHMGMYVATLPLDGLTGDPKEVLLYNEPGRAVSISPVSSGRSRFFVFRSPAVPDFDHRDTEQHRRLLTAAYEGAAWRVPELLDQVKATDELFFDAVSQVRLPRWSSGRIALLGDAASCVSLFGDGSTLAIAGGATLAGALASDGDLGSALDAYETEHRRLVDPRQQSIRAAAALVVPASRTGILLRNLVSRLSPLVAAARSGRR